MINRIEGLEFDDRTLTDITLVSRECWSKLPLNRRIWEYALMVTGGEYEVPDINIDAFKKIIKAEEDGRCMLIVGPPGSGKSTITRILSKVTKPLGSPERYQFVKAIKIVEEFSTEGLKALSKYKFGNWIIDDVGVEQDTSIKGNFKETYNVFEVLMYEMCEANSRGLCRFIISTNLSVKDGNNTFEERYGQRVMSRVTQACEIVKLIGADWRKEKKPIKIWPEVIHKPKEPKGVPMPEDVRELLNKLQRDKVIKDEVKKELSVKQQISGYFEHEWIEQGRRLNDMQERIIETQQGIVTREEFFKICLDLFENKAPA